ncbi:MAG TPA: SDR family NAD(P)-dependent oxidoreductase [Myxococcaceae bacterium]|nr:SDR family NAD(P)-dependent oxidoreductase [Myxococcaceae bacterium]
MAKTIAVTGANSGVGKAVAEELARGGERVLMVCRDEQRGREALQEIQSRTGSNALELFLGDLSSLDSVRAAAAQISAKHPKLDALVSCAAVFVTTHQKTKDGHELMFGTNFLGTYALTLLLGPALQAAAPSRVVTLAAPPGGSPLDFDNLQGEKGFAALGAFARSKTCDVFFAFKLARAWKDKGVTSLAVHPGLVRSGIMRNAALPIRLITALVSRSPEKIAKSIARLATLAESPALTGELVTHGKPMKVAPPIRDEAAQDRLWSLAAQLTRIQ